MGIASLVLGIIGLICSCIPCFSQLLAFLGLIFGIIDMSNKSKGNESKGCAITGTVLSGITIVIGIIMVFGFVIATIISGEYDSMLYY